MKQEQQTRHAARLPGQPAAGQPVQDRFLTHWRSSGPSQGGRFFHGDCRNSRYPPPYIFIGEHVGRARRDGCARLQPSSIDPSAGAVEEVERIGAQLRRVWRADSRFCREVLMRWSRCAGLCELFRRA